ncbi:MAG: CvpA family protein [Saprospiraceae bacterium]|nr:CvpA family protein [Saprospiraceae bacterium]
MIIDIFCLIALGYGFYTGYSRGIIQTVISIITLTFGLLIAFKLAPLGSDFIARITKNSSPLLFFGGFLLIFIVIMLLLKWIGRFFENILESANINIFNNLAGGAIMGTVLVSMFSVLVWFADKTYLISDEIKQQSVSYEYLQPMPATMKNLIQTVMPFAKNIWSQTNDAMNKIDGSDGAVKQEETNKVYDIEEK